MTVYTAAKEKRAITALSTAICILSLAVMLLFNEAIRRGAKKGLDLCLGSLIPTLFPFFILSDLWVGCFSVNRHSILSRLYERLFNISSATLPAVIMGSVCGFPLGIRLAAEQYNRGQINKNELGRICGFANNPSAAFVISGIGAGLFGDVKIGILLYISVIFSAVIVALITRRKSKISCITQDIPRQRYNIVDSIKSAGASSITVSSYIIFFSALIELIATLSKNRLTCAVFAIFLEITGAACSMVSLTEISDITKHFFTAFALGFSGLSVHMQAFSFMPPELSRRRYLFTKLLQGLICAITMATLSFTIEKAAL